MQVPFSLAENRHLYSELCSTSRERDRTCNPFSEVLSWPDSFDAERSTTLSIVSMEGNAALP